MAKRKTVFLPNHYYHIYNRGVHHNNVFRNDADYKFLLKYIKKEAKRCRITVIAYCLMDNHFHFLLRQDGDIEISQFMQAVFQCLYKSL